MSSGSNERKKIVEKHEMMNAKKTTRSVAHNLKNAKKGYKIHSTLCREQMLL